MSKNICVCNISNVSLYTKMLYNLFLLNWSSVHCDLEFELRKKMFYFDEENYI